MKKEEIKHAALMLFAYKGYYGCTMQDIAEAVSLNKSSLYFHFKSKDELFLTVLEEKLEKYIKSIGVHIETVKNKPLKDFLFEVVKAFIKFSTLEGLLIWKKSQLMAVYKSNNEIHNLSSEIIIRYTKKLYNIITQCIIAKGVDLESEDKKHILHSYYLYIMSILDYLMLDKYVIEDYNEIWITHSWNNFCNGIRI